LFINIRHNIKMFKQFMYKRDMYKRALINIKEYFWEDLNKFVHYLCWWPKIAMRSRRMFENWSRLQTYIYCMDLTRLCFLQHSPRHWNCKLYHLWHPPLCKINVILLKLNKSIKYMWRFILNYQEFWDNNTRFTALEISINVKKKN